MINLAGATGGAVLDQSGPGGLLKFTSALTATGVGAKTLTLQGSTAGTGELGGAIVDSSGGATTLLKAGTGTWILSGANTYSGETRITTGTLSLASRASLRAGTDVYISSGATIDLNYTGTIFIHALFINGELQPPGYYGANNHSPFITGTGVLATPLHGAVLVVR